MKNITKNSIFAGECMIEVSGNTHDLDKKQIKMDLNFGGDTFNAAVYFSRLIKKQFNTFYFTGLGQDHLSEMMVKRFKNENLKTDLIQIIKDKYPGLYSIQTDIKGNRSFTYWRNESAAKKMIERCNLDETDKFVSNSELFYYTGISLGSFFISSLETFVPPITAIASILSLTLSTNFSGFSCSYDLNVLKV